MTACGQVITGSDVHRSAMPDEEGFSTDLGNQSTGFTVFSPFYAQVLHKPRYSRESEDDRSNLLVAVVLFYSTGEFSDLVVDRPAFLHQFADFLIRIHHRRVIAVSE